ncbi:hypothetical protein [Plantibacter cousiniae (nom. nud.)]|uniref:hypothetical protein n=1 Tax=Plantibacter cousiniae (nom. nud.) TaxID=199709 RepID=UPI001D37A338|nr:hypothetical protein [Plantibacter cousiniae]CAH0168661.1 hypothetical protein SRABI02_01185 [Plantibacter cousiniae]
MTKLVHPSRYTGGAYTWDGFKSAVRRVDRDSLIAEAAAVTAIFANGEDPTEWKRLGVTPWTVADVARTSLAWGGPGRTRAERQTLFRLCNMNALLIDEESGSSVGSDNEADGVIPDESAEEIEVSRERLGRILARIYFEQFPGQRSILAEVARSILLFGSASEIPSGYSPKMMTPGWFERLTGGFTLDDYVESVFLFSVIAQQQSGRVSLDDLDSPALLELGDVFSLDAARRVFTDHLVTRVAEFKATNRVWQDPLPSAAKKFAFNPLTNRPIVEGIASGGVAPWVQAIITKALPPSIYFLPQTDLRKSFADDLGPVFQHYTGRQLELIDGPKQVLPEERYKLGKQEIDSCDWFLDLPDVLVLIECKARQPIESLRVGGSDWLRSIEDSVGKGIRQLNRSHAHIKSISSVRAEIDTTKPRVGIVVTLEPFYLNQNWLIRERLDQAEFPLGVLSIGELETLVLLSANELGQALLTCAGAAEDNVMLLNPALDETHGRENALLVSTWESIGLFTRINRAAERSGMDAE